MGVIAIRLFGGPLDGTDLVIPDDQPTLRFPFGEVLPAAPEQLLPTTVPEYRQCPTRADLYVYKPLVRVGE